MAVSNKPWSDFTQADYTPEQWRAACLIDTGKGDPDSKDRYKVPVREPDGTLNRNAVHAAAGAHGIGAVEGISPEVRRAAARKLVALYRECEEEAPPSMMAMAGMAAGGGRSSGLVLPWEWRLNHEPLEYREGENGPMAVGYVFRYGKFSENLGGFVETTAPGVATKTVQEQDIRGLFNHNPDYLIGRRGAGTLRFRDSHEGMLYFDDLPDTSMGRDISTLLKRGDLYGSSFSFKIVGREGQSWGKTPEGYPLRTLKQIQMRDVGPVTFPAYPSSEVSLRELTFRSLSVVSHVPVEEIVAAVADARLIEFLTEINEHSRSIMLDEVLSAAEREQATNLITTEENRPREPHRIRRRY